MPKFYWLEVESQQRSPSATSRERIALRTEDERRQKAVTAFLKAKGHKYLRMTNAFATREEAEEAILLLGLPYKINIQPGDFI